MSQRVHHWSYPKRVDLTGKNLIGLSGASRNELAELFPDLQPLASMVQLEVPESEVTAYNGELADEVHEFEHAINGSLRLRRILLRAQTIVEITLGV